MACSRCRSGTRPCELHKELFEYVSRREARAWPFCVGVRFFCRSDNQKLFKQISHPRGRAFIGRHAAAAFSRSVSSASLTRILHGKKK